MEPPEWRAHDFWVSHQPGWRSSAWSQQYAAVNVVREGGEPWHSGNSHGENTHPDRDEWLLFDVGAAIISGFRMSQPDRGSLWAGAEVRDFRIETSSSLDGPFHVVFSGTARRQKPAQDFAFPPAYARFCRLYILNNHGYSHVTVGQIAFKCVLNPLRAALTAARARCPAAGAAADAAENATAAAALRISAAVDDDTFALISDFLEAPWDVQRRLELVSQVEYYLSDANLRKRDGFYRDKIRAGPGQGWLDFSSVLSAPRIRALGVNAAALVQALRLSPNLDVRICQEDRAASLVRHRTEKWIRGDAADVAADVSADALLRGLETLHVGRRRGAARRFQLPQPGPGLPIFDAEWDEQYPWPDDDGGVW